VKADIAENREGVVKLIFSLSYKFLPTIYGFCIIMILWTIYGSQEDYSSKITCPFV
jgi:hypothetical protein